MYQNILIPVNLDHTERMEKAMSTAAVLGKAEGAKLTLFNVGGTGLARVPKDPAEYEAALKDYAAQQSDALGVSFDAVSVYSNDPAAELSSRLKEQIETGGHDLVVMASHVPGLAEYVFASNAGYLASHAKISVFVVR